MKPEEFWNREAILKDYLFTTNLSRAEIAKEMGLTEGEVGKLVKDLNLGWVRRHSKKMSRGQAALVRQIKALIPGEEIIFEHPVGERLRLDIYIPRYQLAFEYHGRQHFFFSNHFHESRADYLNGVERDNRKMELCKEQGIALVVFRFNDELTEEAVFQRILAAFDATPQKRAAPKKSRYKGNPHYEKMKTRAREKRKRDYQMVKAKRNGNRRD